ncbi:OLC1v1012626C1 [Oldenlandia corymbosa var. corymbosa]|uniref:OLC1v1012626C1 n=1 Tax=Oldenlandia corymbosa var. corymbosa TaxID=529605 RepID=A0AAV1DWE7_OLDCO|nr:OLC1v1012626C1 [Oldenlandia corymbosa var. corymbosa]
MNSIHNLIVTSLERSSNTFGTTSESKIMSSRSSRTSSGSRDDEISGLIFRLQRLLPNSSSRNKRAHPSKTLEEVCNYIKKLNKDADDLSDRISQLLASGDINANDAETIRNLLQQ